MFKNNNQLLKLSNTLSKSREDDGIRNSEDLKSNMELNIQKKFKNNFIGPFDLIYDYRHIGRVEDWKNGSYRAKVDSSDIMNLIVSKEILSNTWSLKILNLTDENYQRPDTYNQERRRIELSFRSKY